MPRKQRIVSEGLYHHVVHRGISQQTIFYDDSDRHYFLHRLNASSRRHGMDILAYCLMDNHYHLLVRDSRAQISKAMALVNGPYTTYVNLRHNRAGELLRGRFFLIPSDKPRYALCVLRYIHLNPVAAGLVRAPAACRWASHQDYLKRKDVQFVNTHHMLSILAEIGVRSSRCDEWIRNTHSTFLYEEADSQQQLEVSQRQEASFGAQVPIFQRNLCR